jgi:hypothetical protein
MRKRLITFSDPTDAWLKKEAERLDINVTELVRRIIDEKRGAVVRTATPKGGTQ